MIDMGPMIDFRIAPAPHLCGAVREAVVDFAREHGVPAAELEQFLTALGEALANAIEHGGAHDAIHVQCVVGDDRIVATVRDSGVGLPPSLLERAQRAELPDPSSERGRGLPIMRSCTDIFELESAPGRGTAIVLGRYFRRAGEREFA